MKVLMVNGSAKPNSCTMAAFGEIERILKEEGIEVEYFQIGGGAVRDCIGCAACRKSGSGKCVFDDDVVNRLIDRAKEADGFVLMTGAVKPVADALQCSQASIYRYLSQIRRERTGQRVRPE